MRQPIDGVWRAASEVNSVRSSFLARDDAVDPVVLGGRRGMVAEFALLFPQRLEIGVSLRATPGSWRPLRDHGENLAAARAYLRASEPADDIEQARRPAIEIPKGETGDGAHV